MTETGKSQRRRPGIPVVGIAGNRDQCGNSRRDVLRRLCRHKPRQHHRRVASGMRMTGLQASHQAGHQLRPGCTPSPQNVRGDCDRARDQLGTLGVEPAHGKRDSTVHVLIHVQPQIVRIHTRVCEQLARPEAVYRPSPKPHGSQRTTAALLLSTTGCVCPAQGPRHRQGPNEIPNQVVKVRRTRSVVHMEPPRNSPSASGSLPGCQIAGLL